MCDNFISLHIYFAIVLAEKMIFGGIFSQKFLYFHQENMEQIIRESVFQHFPRLREAEKNVQDEFFNQGKVVSLTKSEFINMEGNSCNNVAFLLDGQARVYKISENGREITLYRIEAGESCILTVSCILSDKDFPAFAVADKDLQAIIVSSNTFQNWVRKYPFWQDYVFNLVSKRLGAIIAVVEEVAFNKVDTRIAKHLINANKNIITETHQEIASEIGSSREVVSRILKDFEHEGLITLSRGKIKIENQQLLEKKSETF